MAGKALKCEQAQDATVVSIMTVRAFEQMLASAGYRRIAPSRLGDRAAGVSLWLGRHHYVIVSGVRVIVGEAVSLACLLRTTLRDLDCATLHRLKEDRA
ncbi:MAG: hypothetical protein HY898_25840 [Deltaproteobacteria bacterium]|nr:hypothetical protein [Deltaproteobacteria bacterium]